MLPAVCEVNLKFIWYCSAIVFLLAFQALSGQCHLARTVLAKLHEHWVKSCLMFHHSDVSIPTLSERSLTAV